MVIDRKPTGLAKSMPVGLAMGWLAEMCVTMLLSAVLTALIAGNVMEWKNVGYYIAATILTGAYIGAWCACRAIQHRRLVVCILSGVMYLLTLAAMSAAFFEFEFVAAGVTGLLSAGGSMAAAIIGGPEKRQRKAGRRRKV